MECMKNVFLCNVNNIAVECRKISLATPIRLCETAQRDDKKAGQRRRASRAHGAETSEPQGTGGTP